jgi:uncharacterized protein (DUF2141 family)
MRPLIVLALAICMGWTPLAAQGTISVRGHVAGASGRYPVYVALWDSAGFLAHPVQELHVPAGAEPAFSFEVTPGRWALSAYEDRNGNGKLDMGLFGPREPSGFGRRFKAWRKPRFGDVAVLFARDTTGADIQLH